MTGGDDDDTALQFLSSCPNPKKQRLDSSSSSSRGGVSNNIVEKCKYMPLRLTDDERRLLAVLENALEVTEYSDNVDVTFSHTQKSRCSRILDGLVDILSIYSGLLLSNNLNKGEDVVCSRSLDDNVPFFRKVFEVGRRYKIMNPTKMRGTYGTLMYILMDAESCAIKDELKLSFVAPIQTVFTFLEEHDMVHLLYEPALVDATSSIADDGGCSKSQDELRLKREHKLHALNALVTSYSNDKVTEVDLRRVIESIADNNAFLHFNAHPVRQMINILTSSFKPHQYNGRYSLDLNSRPSRLYNSFSPYQMGYSSSFTGGGSCLSHDHNTQFNFVLQSLTLWDAIMTETQKLWILSDYDMLTQEYRLCNTGQGYQRLQSCPSVSNEMGKILRKVQGGFGSWVGLSVVHLGDRDVPNSLIFIDKYTQVPRILGPIVQCMMRLPELAGDPAFYDYVRAEWGSVDELKLQILSDFFKHGFDGSGDDGGSCIDGRLTSAWNWCSKLHKKPYYYVFMFAGFQGFDGEF